MSVNVTIFCVYYHSDWCLHLLSSSANIARLLPGLSLLQLSEGGVIPPIFGHLLGSVAKCLSQVLCPSFITKTTDFLRSIHTKR